MPNSPHYCLACVVGFAFWCAFVILCFCRLLVQIWASLSSRVRFPWPWHALKAVQTDFWRQSSVLQYSHQEWFPSDYPPRPTNDPSLFCTPPSHTSNTYRGNRSAPGSSAYSAARKDSGTRGVLWSLRSGFRWRSDHHWRWFRRWCRRRASCNQ